MALAFVIYCAGPVRAQQSVTIEFDGGQVTLRALNAPVRAILAEWARLGGATIVNGDRVSGPPVTLELTGVPERQALDVVLRDVAGYMLAPRRAGATGASSFDRILVLPTSVAPRNPPPQAAGAANSRRRAPRSPVIRRPLTPNVRGNGVAEVNDVQESEEDGPAVTPGPRTRVVPPRPFRPRLPAGAEPLDPNQYENEPEAPADTAAPTSANPFGVPFGSSATPGVVTPVPQQQPAGGLRPQGR